MVRALLITVLAAGVVGCGRSHRTEVALTSSLYTNQLRMHAGDSCEFHLPSGRKVAIWCGHPMSFWRFVEQTDSKCGLETFWSEVPFVKPKEILVKAGTNNSYAVASWRSYIAPSFVTLAGDSARQYELFAEGYLFQIVEDLKETNCLPVAIRVARIR